MDSLKEEIKNALLVKDFDRVTRHALGNKKVFSILISLSYDKEDLLCWRAIEAMGKAAGAVAERDPSTVRTVVQRLIWSVSEESGSIGWSAPEMLGEIVIHSPEKFGDIPPIILSFHSEEMFLRGVLWAMGRIAGAGLEQVDGAADLAEGCLDHRDPMVRGIAAWALSRMKGRDGGDRIAGMASDRERLKIYEECELRDKSVGELIRESFKGSDCRY